MKFATKAIHAGINPDPSTGAVMTPIFQTSTYAQEAPGVHKGYEYSRTHNPTRDALQKNLAALENGKHAFAFASGLAATDTLMRLFRPGDEIIVTNDLYGGTYRLFRRVYETYQIKFRFISMENLSELENQVTPQTRMIWVETPTNPLMKIVDIAGVANISRKHGIMLVVDNTFASPYLQNPLDLGADVVMHSVTKYLGGHSDVVMGALITSNDQLAEQLAFLQNAVGAVAGPMDCFLVLRGIKTLHLRMRQHCENARIIAEWLDQHPAVSKVYYPGFEHHPNHHIARRQMRDFGGMVSFLFKEDDMALATAFMSNLKVFTLAESLGGVESLCCHPASMTHASIPKAEREKAGLRDTLIRLSVGVEDVEDLIADLAQAMEKAFQKV